MKKILSLLLTFSLLLPFLCPENASAANSSPFTRMDDPGLLTYMEDTLYDSLVETLNSDQYYVENVKAIYISQEYLDELAYNSRANVFFGYTLSELDEQFEGKRYIFTLGENKETVVESWKNYDNVYEKVLRNVAIGTGVILVCVTVSAVTAGAGAPAVSVIFAAAAKGGTIGALSGAGFGAVSAGIITGMRTGDMDAALKSAMLSGSEGFKWGAISGALTGGMSKAKALRAASSPQLPMNDVAKIQMESKYPLEVIKKFNSYDEYMVYRQAGLRPNIVDSKTALIRDIDLMQTDSFGKTNLQRMLEGNPPHDPSGISYELHHIGQSDKSPFAILTQAEHRGEGNFKILHQILRGSEVNHGSEFMIKKTKFWKELGNQLNVGK